MVRVGTAILALAQPPGLSAGQGGFIPLSSFPINLPSIRIRRNRHENHFPGGGNMAAALDRWPGQAGLCRGRPAGRGVVRRGAEQLQDSFMRAVEVFRTSRSWLRRVGAGCEAPAQMKVALALISGRLDKQVVVEIAVGLRPADIGRWLGGHT